MSIEPVSLLGLRSDNFEVQETILKKPVEHEDFPCLEKFSTENQFENNPYEELANLVETDLLKIKDETTHEKIERLEKKVSLLQQQLCSARQQPMQHDDQVEVLKNQVIREQTELRKLRKENDKLKLKIRGLEDQLQELEHRPSTSFEKEHLKRKVAELEKKLEEEKKCASEAKQAEANANDKVADLRTELSSKDKEIADFTLDLKNARSEANRYSSFYQMIHTALAVQQQEFTEILNDKNDMKGKLECANMKCEMDDITIGALKKENKNLHSVLQVLGHLDEDDVVGQRCLVPRCDQCQQLHNRNDQVCRYHPIPPWRHNQWKKFPNLKDKAENPAFHNYSYYLCCDVLSRNRPEGCWTLGSHHTSLIGALRRPQPQY